GPPQGHPKTSDAPLGPPSGQPPAASKGAGTGVVCCPGLPVDRPLRAITEPGRGGEPGITSPAGNEGPAPTRTRDRAPPPTDGQPLRPGDCARSAPAKPTGAARTAHRRGHQGSPGANQPQP